jgi:DNA-binding NarL/FixJ family response regulator
MKIENRYPKLPSATSVPGSSAVGPHPAFTVEESIVMQGFAAGKSDKQVRIELHIPLQLFYRLLRNLMEKTQTYDRMGLQVWALRQRQHADSRQTERDYEWKQPA